MAKKLIGLAIALCLVATAGVMLAEDEKPSVERLDPETLKSMSKEERQVYKRQYRAARRAARNPGAPPAPPRAIQPGDRTRQEPRLRIPGTAISYHSGTLSATTASGVVTGNRFDTALTVMGGLGAVEMSGSITMLTFDMATVSSTYVSFFDQLSGTMANWITSLSVPMVTGSNVVTLTTAVNYVGSSFLAGVWVNTTSSTAVNVATGTVGGQGFHGMVINSNGAGFSALTMTNAAFAVQGNVATPVELMSFTLE